MKSSSLLFFFFVSSVNAHVIDLKLRAELVITTNFHEMTNQLTGWLKIDFVVSHRTSTYRREEPSSLHVAVTGISNHSFHMKLIIFPGSICHG